MNLFDPYLFLSLLTAHLIGDFVLQTSYDVLHKQHLPVLFKHAFTIAILSWLFSGSLALWVLIPWIGFTHAATDYIKVAYGDQIGEPFAMFLTDQFIHLLIIMITAFGIPALMTYESVWVLLSEEIYVQAMFIISGIVLAVRVGGIVIGIWISPMLQMLEPSMKRRFESSGKVIGELERLLIFFFVFVGLYSVIGFLLASKALFRLGTLMHADQRTESEYIIVGTLISFTWALIFAWLTHFLLVYPGV